ncbi:MAG: amidohydrolase [Christensenellaceae bacterium]|nr:amidohydrolase [Christensenellaceae bacterium]
MNNIVNDILASSVSLRHELHRNAELSSHETVTKRLLMKYLSKNTSLELHDMGSWFYAAYRCGVGRNIAFRADFDALPIGEGQALEYASKNPGVSHKCGHDGHSACLCAFAQLIDRTGCKNNVFFLFQHAEETGCGAYECQRLIELEHIDEIYGFHNMPGLPFGSVAVHTGTAACASKGLVLSFAGVTSHASQPERGRNPAFAISKLICDIPESIKPDKYSGMVLCTVIRVDIGEEAFGTSAGRGRLMLTIRAEHESEMDSLEAHLTELAQDYADADSLTLSIEYREPFPETYNHEESAERVRKSCTELGIPIARWDEPFRSSEDFGVYTKRTKGALFYVGCGENYAPLHTEGYDFPDDMIKTVISLYGKLSENNYHFV